MTRVRSVRKFALAASERGFSLIEMMVVILVLSVVIGALYQQIASMQQRARTEQVKLDYIQEARDFVDQFSRDANQIGFPNGRLIDPLSASWSPALSNPVLNDSRVATGLVKADANELWFEGDLAGTGTVQSVVYKINGSGVCAVCLQRSQTDKVAGSPLSGQTQSWGTEVNDVISNTIFTYFKADGTQVVGLPVDINSAPQTIASIKTIRMSVRLTNTNTVDPQTGQPLEMTFQGEVTINNCSLAATGQTMSCN